MGRKKSVFDYVERVDAIEEEDEDGFSEDVEIKGTVIQSFSFAADPQPLPVETKPEIPKKLIDNRKL
ncbi:hypothetical protein HMPREF1982_04736 [Clostridiales bacterium oral taxon 876 str. F0540]|nr:hypothetical protein HMPREF1982_04736 [Clostridiales bacterium oral taxon 876 str. F0540]